MWVLSCNVLLTRRQEMCFVQDEAGVLQWSGKDTHSAIVFLIEADQPDFLLADGHEEHTLHITARRV